VIEIDIVCVSYKWIWFTNFLWIWFTHLWHYVKLWEM